jgi:diguanylate cyclase (GGDEF)-like protein/PAS domain S-box-containing protein
MKLLYPNIKVMIVTIILLSIIEVSLIGSGLNGTLESILTLAIPVLNLLLVVFLAAMLKRIIRQAANKEKQYRKLLDLSPEAIYVHRKGNIIYSNEAGATLLGFNEPGELVNRSWKGILDPKSYDSLKSSSNKYESNQLFKFHRLTFYRVDGSSRYVEAKSTYIEFDGEPAREVIARDITVQENNQKMLKEFSYLDTLTKLPNRRSLMDQLDEIINDSQQKNASFGLMFIDLDGFKQINDTHGHEKGDLLLKEVSDYFKLCIRDVDVVARFGGDEFIILLPGAMQLDCIHVAERIITHPNLSVIMSGYSPQVTLSIGIALYPNNGEDATTLIKHADAAMYQAKKLGKNNYQLFEIETSW